MPILIDTSVAIGLLDADAPLIKRKRDERDVAFLSIISRIELIPGLYSERGLIEARAKRLEIFLDELEILPFTALEADAYQLIIAAKGFSRRLIVDRMIAATALANDLTLATLNPRDFRDIAGLAVEDWSA